MKIKICSCEIPALMRPNGLIKVKKTRVDGDVMFARLAGAVNAGVAAVRSRGKYFFVAPERLGGVREIGADSLTNALHFGVYDMEDAVAKRRRPGRKRKAGK